MYFDNRYVQNIAKPKKAYTSFCSNDTLRSDKSKPKMPVITKEEIAEYSNINGIRVAVCAIAKNENKYIREWVEYYKNLGVDKIFLFDNNDINGEKFETSINDHIKSKFVKIINKRGIEKGLVYDKDGINLQPKCYCDCYEQYGEFFDWMCFFDIDEFLIFKNDTLKGFLSNKKFTNFDTILIPWKLYDDNDHVAYENIPITKRFTRVSSTQNYGVKSIVRCGQQIANKKQENLIHRFVLKDAKICYADGSADIQNRTDWTIVKSKYKLQPAYLNHYNTKTIGEYLFRHLGRHWGTGIKNTKNAKTYKDVLNNFKTYNTMTDAKRKYVINYTGKQYNGEKAVISLTTWSARIKNVYKTINSLLEKCPGFHIVLVLSKDEFPNKNNDLPDSLLSLIWHLKLEILWVDKNYKAFKKILFTMNKYKDLPIISADDDLIYTENYALKLYKTWKDNPKYKHITSHHSKMKCGCGACSLYAPYCFKDAYKVINDKLVSTIEDDFFYQFLCNKYGIKQYYLNDYWPWTAHSENNAMSDIYKKEPIETRLAKYEKIYESLNFNDDFKPIVSFTSYAPRLQYCATVIKSILNNTIQPYKIVLTLYKEDAELVKNYKELNNFIKAGIVELIVTNVDIKSHKKYYYVMKKYTQNPIITIDDDCEYQKDFIESFKPYYEKYPNCVLGRRVHKKTYDFSHNLLPYKKWEFECQSITTPSTELLCIGVGGILYPPGCFNINNISMDQINEYISVDDIYLHYLTLKKGMKIVYVKNNMNHPKLIAGSEKSALWFTVNSIGGETTNDKAIKKLLK